MSLFKKLKTNSDFITPVEENWFFLLYYLEC